MDEKTRKQNVLIVHNYYQIPGGEDTVVANEMRMLRENGHKVMLYSRNNLELKSMSKFQKLMMPINTIFNLKTYKEIKQIIRKESIDIVHIHNTLSLISPSVYYAAKTCTVPIVQTIHNFRLLCPGATFYRDGQICEDRVRQGLYCAVKHGCYRNSKFQTLACVISTAIHRMTGIYGKINYICLTEFTRKKLLTQKQIKPERISVKPNVVYDFGGHGKPTDYFVFVGRLEKIKGIELLVNTFKKMPNIKLKIIGTGSLNDEIKQKIKSEQINNIELLGFMNRDEVNRVVCGAKALIMCSQWYETFGMVIVEAYSNGVPVIVGNIGNIQELVKPDVTGKLFTYNSEDALANVVLNFNEEEISLFGRNCYKYYKNNFTPENNYKKLISIYEKISV